MTRRQQRLLPHNMRRRPQRKRLLSVSKSEAALAPLTVPTIIAPVGRRLSPPADKLFPDLLNRARSARAAATPQSMGPAHEAATMRDAIAPTSEAEFADLPIAVQRKYFSTLERLRIAQSSETAGNELEIRGKRPVPETQTSHHRAESTHTNTRRLRKTSRARSTSISLEDISWFQTLPDKIQRKQFSKEEQQHFRRPTQRKSVVLDAADEAIYKRSRRNREYASSINQQPLERAPLAGANNDMQVTKRERPTSTALAMAEQFRWMDEETDFDRKLQLDNYHANLPDVVIPSPQSSIRPSFRRNMSISNMPFSRPHVPAPIRTTSGPTSFSGASTPLSRGHSRAMSLMSPRFSPEADTSRHSIDPHATHYKNPDARLKLRVYLASPQKFDEAIEFGFPSDDDVLETLADKENQVPSRPEASGSGLSDANKTFFHDDVGSLLDDDASIAEPDSPVTPSEDLFRPQHSRLMSVSDTSTTGRSEFAHLGFRKPALHKHAESYSLSSAGAREMTLRMTLTRPDLRAGEDVIYGWQAKGKTKSSSNSELHPALEPASMRGPFDGDDGWGPLPKDDGVVKRLWNKVRAQRKAAFV